MTHWKEPLDVRRHRDYVSGAQDAGGCPVDPSTSDGWVYFVRTCSFTFSFATLGQLREASDYFWQRIHPARREAGHELEHYWQRWFERLPAGLIGGSKRPRVRRALARALASFTVTQPTVVRKRRPLDRSASADCDLAGRRVAIAGVIPPSATAEAVIASLQPLIEAKGGLVLGSVLQRRGVSRSARSGGAAAARSAMALNPATYLGAGKARELAELCRSRKVDVVVFVNPLSLAQHRRLQALSGTLVVSFAGPEAGAPSPTSVVR